MSQQEKELEQQLKALFDMGRCQELFWSFECLHKETAIWRLCGMFGHRTMHQCMMSVRVPVNIHIPIKEKCPECGGPRQGWYPGSLMEAYIWLPDKAENIARLLVSPNCGVEVGRSFQQWAASLGKGVPARAKPDKSDKNIGPDRRKFVERHPRDPTEVLLSEVKVSNTISFDGRYSTKI